MKTRRWKRALSVVLSGALLMTSLSAAMTAFAAEDPTDTDPEYQAGITNMVQFVKDNPDFVSNVLEQPGMPDKLGTSVYDNADGDFLTFYNSMVSTALKYAELSGITPGSNNMKQCLPPVIEDVKAQIEDETTKAVLEDRYQDTGIHLPSFDH